MNSLLNILLAPFRWISSLALRIVFILCILLAILLVTPGWYVPFVVEKVIEYKTGFAVSFGDTHINLFTGKIDFWDIKIENPERFEEKTFVNVKELSLHIEPLSLAKKVFVCDQFVLNISNLGWVKTSQEEVNLNAFMEGLEGASKDKSATTSTKEQTPAKPLPEFLVKKLTIDLASVDRYDFTKSPPDHKAYTMNFHFEVTDAHNMEEILKPLMSQLSKQGVSFLAQSVLESLIDSSTYKDMASGLLDSIPGLDGVGEGVSEGFKKLFKVFE